MPVCPAAQHTPFVHTGVTPLQHVPAPPVGEGQPVWPEAQQTPLVQVGVAPEQQTVPVLVWHTLALGQQAPATQVLPTAQQVLVPQHSRPGGQQVLPPQQLLPAVGQQVPPQQVELAAQHTPGVPQQLCPALQQTPLQQMLPLAQQVLLQTWVLLATQVPLQKVSPAGQAQAQLGPWGVCPSGQLKQVATPPVGVHTVVPLGQTQAQVAALSTWLSGQLVTQVPWHSVFPVGHWQVQVVWLRVWPPVQLVIHAPVVVHRVLPGGQAQLQVGPLGTWPPVQAGTQRALALQNCCPAGQTHWQLALRISPPRQAATQVGAPPGGVQSWAPALHWQLQLTELSTWPLPVGQGLTQRSLPPPLHTVCPEGQAQMCWALVPLYAGLGAQ